MSFLSLMWSGLFRRQTRTVLTLFSIIVAFLLFGLLRSIADVFSGGVDVAGADRLIVQPKYSIIDPLPIGHMGIRFATVPGVAMVTHADWFGGFYQDHKNFFPKYPVTPQDWFAAYPEFAIDPAQLEKFRQHPHRRRRAGRARGEVRLARRRQDSDRGRHLSEKRQLAAVGIRSRRHVHSAVGADRARTAFLFNYDYFDEARQFGQGQVGWFVVRVSDPSKAAEIARAIDKLFENSANETRTATEAEFARQFANQIGNIGLMMGGILGAVFFTIILLTGNTMAQAFRERVPELAVLKTLGFSDARVSLLVLGEAVLLTLVGGAIGPRHRGAARAGRRARRSRTSCPGSQLCGRRSRRDSRIAVLMGLRRRRGAGADRTATAHRRCAAGALTCSARSAKSR